MAENRFVNVEILREKIPCGESVTTVYRDENGVIVRQDCEIRVSSAPQVFAAAGEVK